MSSDITIRQATALDLAAAQSWLADAGLPSEDLTEKHMNKFLLAMEGDMPVGMIGMEHFGTVGLLRSLVVDPSLRSAGTGRRLVSALESAAMSQGVVELWLLTIGADGFFTRLSYDVRERSDSPASIQSTAEYSSLCPGDAVLMSKQL